MASLTVAMPILLHFETLPGKENVATLEPGDPGGYTKYGIAQRWHPGIDVKNLTLEQATGIYDSEYWTKFWCDRIESQLVATQLFLAVVNMNQHSAVMNLQSAVLSTAFMENLFCDGEMGPATVSLLNSQTTNPVSEQQIVKAYSALNAKYYKSLHNTRDINGWLCRAAWPHMETGAWPYIDPHWSPA